MNRERLICDQRSGCVAIYRESSADDTNGCHASDPRNLAYSNAGAVYDGNAWTMDQNVQQIFADMVAAYNEKYNL